MRALLLILLAGVASLGAQSAPGGKATYRDLPVMLRASKVTPLQAILQIAAANRIPLGSAIETLAYKWNQYDLGRAGCEDAFAAVP